MIILTTKYIFKSSVWKNILFLSIILTIKINALAIHPPVTQTIPIQQLEGYTHYDAITKKIINEAKQLTDLNLTYLYGSADPKNKGMDCSGVIYYLLKQLGVSSPPRQASTLYLWALKEGNMHTIKNNDFVPDESSELKPGDLLFWSGTYAINRYPPITHVSIYLGRNKNNQPLMFGSSDGRPYQNREMWGVSVFDFIIPPKNSQVKLVGYSCIPTLTCNI